MSKPRVEQLHDAEAALRAAVAQAGEALQAAEARHRAATAEMQQANETLQLAKEANVRAHEALQRHLATTPNWVPEAVKAPTEKA